MLQSHNCDCASLLRKIFSTDTIQFAQGVRTTFNVFDSLDALYTVNDVCQNLMSLPSLVRGHTETFSSFKQRFEVQVSRFNERSNS